MKALKGSANSSHGVGCIPHIVHNIRWRPNKSSVSKEESEVLPITSQGSAFFYV